MPAALILGPAECGTSAIRVANALQFHAPLDAAHHEQVPQDAYGHALVYACLPRCRAAAVSSCSTRRGVYGNSTSMTRTAARSPQTPG